jgi:hydrogenase maturation protease
MTGTGGGSCGRGVLVAGIGNIFLGDDGFGVEVIKAIDRSALPASVRVADYGIRGVHLAYDLLDGDYQTLIMVDAAPVGGPPGELAVLRVDTGRPPGEAAPEPSPVDGHAMDPQAVLDVLARLGGQVGSVFVVGCQPAVLAEGMELSDPVRCAVGEAARMVTELAIREAGRTPAAASAGAGMERASA